MPGINSPPGVIVTCQPWPFCAGQFDHNFEYNDDGGGNDDGGVVVMMMLVRRMRM